MPPTPEIASRRRERVPRVSLERLYRTPTIGAGCWSPDGRYVCFPSNLSGRHNLWFVDSLGGWPLQLTVSEQRQVPGGWSPDGRWIVFQSDYEGNEQWDLFAVSTEDGDERNLTGTPDISEEEPRWSPDGRWLAYISKARASSSYEVHVMDFATGEIHQITRNTAKEFSHSSPVWSPDSRFLAFTRSRADQKSDAILVAAVTGGEVRVATVSDGEHNYHAEDWSPDGSWLLVTSNARNRFSNVALLAAADGTLDWLTEETWECSAGSFHPSGRWLAWERNHGGNQEVFLFDLETRHSIAAPLREGLNSLGPEVFSRDGLRMLYSYSGPAEPRDLYTWRIGTGESVRLTNSLLAAMDPEALVEPYRVEYSSPDGLRIPAFLYVPHNLDRDGSHAGIVHVHGGPSAQHRNGFHRGIQYLVNRGYVVIAPDYRGSTGYGKNFEEKNRFDMGGGDLEDVTAAARYLESTGYVSGRRIALMGASYGGYLTMMGLTRRPEVWAAGVAIVPFVNWFTELEHEDPILREWDLATMGDPVTNHALYRERSPIHFIDAVRAPLLILAGDNDPRCPVEESSQVVEALRRRGGVVEYKFYENEGHGFARIENAVDSFQSTAAFLDRYVR